MPITVTTKRWEQDPWKSQNIKKPLVDKLLFGNLKGGGVIKIDLYKGKLKFTESKNKVKV